MSRVWDENWFGSTRTLDVHIRWLRQKLDDDPRSRASSTRPRRRLPLHRAGRVGGVSLRARLLLALAYVLVLAVLALLVPLVFSVATASTPKSAPRRARRPTWSRRRSPTRRDCAGSSSRRPGPCAGA
jgi:hypothetical protein